MRKNYSQTLLTEANRIPHKIKVKINENKVINIPKEGIGINIGLDALAKGCYPDINDKKGWQHILDNLSYLSPHWLCITLPVEEIINKEGEIKNEGEALKQFDYFYQWAEANKANIILMFPKNVPSWLRFKETISHSPAPADLNSYANLICSALNYFIHNKKYTQIKYLTIFGEPFNEDAGDFSFGTPEDIDPYVYYVEMHKVVRSALDNHGLSG